MKLLFVSENKVYVRYMEVVPRQWETITVQSEFLNEHDKRFKVVTVSYNPPESQLRRLHNAITKEKNVWKDILFNKKKPVTTLLEIERITLDRDPWLRDDNN